MINYEKFPVKIELLCTYQLLCTGSLCRKWEQFWTGSLCYECGQFLVQVACVMNVDSFFTGCLCHKCRLLPGIDCVMNVDNFAEVGCVMNVNSSVGLKRKFCFCIFSNIFVKVIFTFLRAKMFAKILAKKITFL
jgi:hypothetical protein